MSTFADYISIKRRYSRSVNLERDTEIPDAVEGYVPTSRAIDVLERFLWSLLRANSVRAWTLTGAYGTGKSALAHFLTSLCSPKKHPSREQAIKILGETAPNTVTYSMANNDIPENGFIRAVVTAQREPISHSVIRALKRGCQLYWRNHRGPKPKILKKILDISSKAGRGDAVDNLSLVRLVEEVAKVSKTGLLLIIDELGKNLEYSAQNQAVEDLYLLQQLAELPSGEEDPKIFVFGLLHQSFADYAQSITASERNEWAKIQGRFEDVPFIESPERVIRLIGRAMQKSKFSNIQFSVSRWAKRWKKSFDRYEFSKNISLEDILSIFPLHPLTAIALPTLCTKFSQNDRTLFTFLASEEPHSFTNFLEETTFKKERPSTFRLPRIYDYFVESAGMSIGLRPQFQRWVEIEDRISDAKHLGQDLVAVLKAVGTLNLISTAGSLRASRDLVVLAMCDEGNTGRDAEHWNKMIDELLAKGFLTWRKQLDELRIWEGSDFDIEKEIYNRSEILNTSLAALLNEYFPLRPIIAQRHSYVTGTLRCFERQYFDNLSKLEKAVCSSSESDGLICYWVAEREWLTNMPARTEDGRPLIILCGTQIKKLRQACYEFTALKDIEANSSHLQTDGVARKEVSQRLFLSERVLNEAIARSFDLSSSGVLAFVNGAKKKINSTVALSVSVSKVCDSVYEKGLVLWNELINKKVLTSQGTSARRKLVEAMLTRSTEENLGLKGYGPEFTIYESVLRITGIHRSKGETYHFDTPYEKSGVYEVWKAIEAYCHEASEGAREIRKLFQLLEKPPYGVKKGVIPVLLLSVLLYHSEHTSLYHNGTFVPIIKPEHIELLVRKPERFSVKYFEISGVRAEIFKQLERIVAPKGFSHSNKIRSSTLLSIVKPLIRFVASLPLYSQKTNCLSPAARAVRSALIGAKEPDELLFVSLPRACGLLFDTTASGNVAVAGLFRKKLHSALKELQIAYGGLLDRCTILLYEAFSVRGERAKLREDLRVRATHLSGQVIEKVMKSFVLAAVDESRDEKQWLESIMLIIADKSPAMWTDDDLRVFEINLSDLARRFKNIEALQKRPGSSRNEGFDACRLTVTYPDGNEINEVIWVDRTDRPRIEEIVSQFLANENLKCNIRLAKAVIAGLVENVLPQTPSWEDAEIKQIREGNKIV